MKKGFTLIELLAIIVIMGLIILIVVPVVGNMVEEAKEKSAIVSAQEYLKLVDDYVMTQKVDNPVNKLRKGKTYQVEDNTTMIDNGNLLVGENEIDLDLTFNLNSILELNGSKPTDGYVTMSTNKVNEAYLVINKYLIYCNNKKECTVKGEYVNLSDVEDIILKNKELVKINETTYKLSLHPNIETYKLNVEIVTSDSKADGRLANYSVLDDSILSISSDGVITPKQEGSTTVIIRVGDKEIRVIVNIMNDSLIGQITDDTLTSGIHTFKVKGVTYTAHVIVLEGDQVITENTQYGDENDCASATSMAKNMVIVKVKGDYTVNAGVTVEPYHNQYGGPKGFLLYVEGTLTNNGTIDNSHGAYAEGQDIYLYKNKDNTYEYVPKLGASGGAQVSSTGYYTNINGQAGLNGTGRQTGGGGTGAAAVGTSQKGGNGTSYSGGSGSGAGSNKGTGLSGSSKGGAGGNGIFANKEAGGGNGSGKVGGGAGNPGGIASYTEENRTVTTSPDKGNDGTGGLLIIFADRFVNNGNITANGANGGLKDISGGSSGGGSINIFTNQPTNIDRLGIVTNDRYNEILGNVNVNGGIAVGSSLKSGAGGSGTVNIGEIRDGMYYDLHDAIDQDKEAYEESITKKGSSLLAILNDDTLTSGYYVFKANNTKYPVHLYVYNNDQTITENTRYGDVFDISNGVSMSKNMVVVKIKGNYTVNSGVKVEPYYNQYGGPKGFLLYVEGILTNNGTIDNSHGAYAEGQDIYLYKNKDNTYEYVPAVGSSGGAQVSSTGSYTRKNGLAGSNGTGRQTGGGGSGAAAVGISQKGGNGTSYSGGSGSGAGSGSGTGLGGSNYGGAGGNGVYDHSIGGGNGSSDVSGGAGNPGGNAFYREENRTVTTSPDKGNDGTGGLLIIYANTFINNSSITATGTTAGVKTLPGGSSGGGSINIFYNEISTLGTLNANGGAQVSGTTWGYLGGAGGTGTITVGSIITGTFVKAN